MTAEERLLANAEIDAAIEQAAVSTDYADRLAAEGINYRRDGRRRPPRHPLPGRHLDSGVSRLDLVVGPNSAGKSTFVRFHAGGVTADRPAQRNGQSGPTPDFISGLAQD
ncbi:MAG: hypothetical protein ABGZ36_22710 [Actinomycetota bacterium]